MRPAGCRRHLRPFALANLPPDRTAARAKSAVWEDAQQLALVVAALKLVDDHRPFAADEYKFRYGADWKANLGDGGGSGALKQDGGNLKITKAGTYTITLKPASLNSDGKVSDGSTYTIK